MKELSITKRSREEVMQSLKQDSIIWKRFQDFSADQQEELILFCMGERSFRVTYDTVFHSLLDPFVHPRRLEHLLSAILGQKVKIRQTLPREGILLQEDAALVIMDVVVELEDGSLVSIEMQRAGYKFPVERADCYGSDLIVRRYEEIKQEIREYNEVMKQQALLEDKEAPPKKVFAYSMMPKTIIIVIMENSTAVFHRDKEHAVHCRTSKFDTGLAGAEGLREDWFLCLDIYREFVHTKIKSKRDAWMLFLGSTKMEHMQEVCAAYPEFIPLYQEVFDLTKDIRRLVGMFSEALRLLDREEEKLVIQETYDELNKARKMVQQVKNELKQKQGELQQVKNELQEKDSELQEKDSELQEKDSELQEKDSELQEKDSELREKDSKLQEKDSALQEKDSELQEKDSALQEKDLELQEKDYKLQEKDSELKEKDSALQEKDREIAELKRLLKSQS